jgi:hypothetical protein
LRQRRNTYGTSTLPVLERCDDERLPAYLETTSPRSRALPAPRHGFEITGQFSVGPRVAADLADVADSQQVILSPVNLSFC